MREQKRAYAADLKFKSLLFADTRGSKILNLHYVPKLPKTHGITFSYKKRKRTREREKGGEAETKRTDNQECQGRVRGRVTIERDHGTLLYMSHYKTDSIIAIFQEL